MASLANIMMHKMQPGQARPAVNTGAAVPYPYAILLVLINVFALILLFTLRSADDNRLTSWQWMFTEQQIYILALLLTGILFVLWRQSSRHALWKPGARDLFVAASAIGMVFWSEPEIIVDAARYFTQAKYLAEYGPVYFLQQWGYEIGAWTDLPLLPFIYGLLFKFFGESRLVIQLATTLMFAGSVVLTYYIGKTLWDDRLGLYGGALLLAMPFLLTQVPLMLVDVPSMFFLAMAVCFSLQAINRGTKAWIALAASAIALAVLCKYSTWLMLSVLPVILLASKRKNWRQESKHLLFILFGAGLLLAPFFLWKLDVFITQWQLLTDYQVPGLQRWQESPLSTFFYQIHPFVSLAAIGSIYFAIRQRDRRFLPVAWMMLLIVILDINRSRYALIAFPMLALMAAYAIRQIANIRIQQYLVVSMIAASLVITLGGYRPFLQNDSAINLQYAGAYLDKMKVSAVEVIVLPQPQSTINPLISIPLLDLFTRQKIIYRQMPELIASPAAHVLSTSPLRFSWEYRLPRFYADDNLMTNRAIAVIAGSAHQALPADLRQRLQGYQPAVRFIHQNGVFRYTTIVTIYKSTRSNVQEGRSVT